MRFMTYNILEGGRTHGDRLQTIVEIVVRSRPDVLLLNECNAFADDGMETLFRLEREFGMRAFFAELSTGFHLTVFVRDLLVLGVERFDTWFHHGALLLRLDQNGKPLTVLATHLCPFSSEARLREAQYLSSYVREERVVVMGDMNNISRYDVQRLDLESMLPYRRARHLMPGTSVVDTRPMDVLEATGLVDLWQQAYPSRLGATLPTPLVEREPKPVLRVDYIYATAALAAGLTRCEVLIDHATSGASDHYPVIADITM